MSTPIDCATVKNNFKTLHTHLFSQGSLLGLRVENNALQSYKVPLVKKICLYVRDFFLQLLSKLTLGCWAWDPAREVRQLIFSQANWANTFVANSNSNTDLTALKDALEAITNLKFTASGLDQLAGYQISNDTIQAIVLKLLLAINAKLPSQPQAPIEDDSDDEQDSDIKIDTSISIPTERRPIPVQPAVVTSAQNPIAPPQPAPAPTIQSAASIVPSVSPAVRQAAEKNLKYLQSRRTTVWLDSTHKPSEITLASWNSTRPLYSKNRQDTATETLTYGLHANHQFNVFDEPFQNIGTITFEIFRDHVLITEIETHADDSIAKRLVETAIRTSFNRGLQGRVRAKVDGILQRALWVLGFHPEHELRTRRASNNSWDNHQQVNKVLEAWRDRLDEINEKDHKEVYDALQKAKECLTKEQKTKAQDPILPRGTIANTFVKEHWLWSDWERTHVYYHTCFNRFDEFSQAWGAPPSTSGIPPACPEHCYPAYNSENFMYLPEDRIKEYEELFKKEDATASS